ncbi:hypothetical protein FA09DRAFT_286388, partial [Tilletiopsis washingtonensis]
ADALAADFHATLARSFPAVAHLRGAASEEAAEPALGALRDTLAALQSTVDALVELVYHVDAWTAEARGHSVGQDPQQALKHVGGLVDMYQTELLAKREALADLTCEEIGLDEFAERWQNCREIEEGKKQTMDELADLL